MTKLSTTLAVDRFYLRHSSRRLDDLKLRKLMSSDVLLIGMAKHYPGTGIVLNEGMPRYIKDSSEKELET